MSADDGADEPGEVDEQVVTAWQDVLAAEHAAVYAYGVAAGRLPRDTGAQRRADEAYRAHLQRRDDVAALVAGAGGTPAQAEPAYDLPGAIDDAAAARTLGQRVEDRCTVVHAAVVAAAGGDARAAAVDWLIDSSTRLVGWGGRASALPGVERP